MKSIKEGKIHLEFRLGNLLDRVAGDEELASIASAQIQSEESARAKSAFQFQRNIRFCVMSLCAFKSACDRSIS